MINTNKISLKISLLILIGLFILDPIFYFIRYIYNIKVPIGFMSIILEIILTLLFIITVNKTRIQRKIITIMLCYITALLIIILNSPYGNFDYLIIASEYIGMTVFSYYIIKNLDLKGINKNLQKIFVILPVLIIILSYNFNVKELSLSGLNYLRIGDSIAFIGILTLISIKKIKNYVIVFFLYTISLFMLTGRAPLILYILISIILIMMKYKLKKNILIAMITILLVLLIPWERYISSINIHNNRIVRLIVLKNKDTSFSERVEVFHTGIEVIKENILWDNFAWQIRNRTPGLYIHNILSYWAQFGIFMFLITFVLQFYPIYYLIKHKNKIPRNIKIYTIVITLFIALNSLILKSFMYTLTFFPIGIVYYISERIEKNWNNIV